MKIFTILFAVIFACLLVVPSLAQADPISGAIASALLGAGVSAGVAAAIGSFVVSAVVSIGLSLAQAAFQDKPKTIVQNEIQTNVTTGGSTTGHKFILGRYATAGHMMMPMRTYSSANNAVLDVLNYVVEISNVSGIALNSVIVDNRKCTLSSTQNSVYGNRLVQLEKYNPIAKQIIHNGYIRFYDGTQIAADPQLVSKYGTGVRPVDNSFKGQGIAYAVVTFIRNPDIFPNFPAVKFDVDGIPLYDPRLDSTIGGSGSHRFGNSSTYEHTLNPVVMIYNIMRGITLSTGDIYGGQIDEEDLPFDNWTAAMNACDVLIGSRKTYRAGIEVNVAENPPNEIIEELKKACVAQMTEIGGVFKIQVGPPSSSILAITDDDILISEPSDLEPYPGIEGTYNAAIGTYVSPQAKWQGVEIDPLYNPTWEAEDGNRRLTLELGLPAVYIKTQAAQILDSLINDSRRFRVHNLVVPPSAAHLEPLDTISWTSTRNGYTSKLFEIQHAERRLGTAQQFVTIRERDSSGFRLDEF